MALHVLPDNRSPAEAAHDLVIALVTSGHFETAGKSYEEIFQMLDDAEGVFCRLYKLKVMSILKMREEYNIRSDQEKLLNQ
ncbi:hypothetical protein ACEV60_22145 [Enterobacter ludwigii]|jgi:hypothetical protein|uniref:hypothetical protein n=1 Tax=Enterobacter TaxID=547 RepID=UPI0003D7E8DC|nr:hypothetical protein [Enterobacter ludwigii]AHE73323.1 hypothetical protein M942_20035 [Enterobacter ludwigii]